MQGELVGRRNLELDFLREYSTAVRDRCQLIENEAAFAVLHEDADGAAGRRQLEGPLMTVLMD